MFIAPKALITFFYHTNGDDFKKSAGGGNTMTKIDEKKIHHIVNTLEKLEYGSIVITVHEGEITQIETTEKRRFSLTKDGTKVRKSLK